MPSTRSSSHRFNITFADATWQTLQHLAGVKGKSVADTLRDAIALERWFWEQQRDGNKILLEDQHGRVREVISR